MSSPAFEIKFADEVESEVQEIFQWYLTRSTTAAFSFIDSLSFII